MSDAEGGKKSGYRLEYASSARGKCKGPKPCAGTVIGKGELRMGSLVDFKGNTSFTWRHWGCVTDTIIRNMKKSFEEPEELDGFDDLSGDDQEKVRKAWEEGHVADEDIPESARKTGDEDDEDDDEGKPKTKKTAAKSSKKKDEGDGKGVFKLEYASSGRSKCKECGSNVGKDFFRLGNEVDFRGKKSFAWRHWGCADEKMITSLKASYAEPSEIEGFGGLQDGEKDKVRRAWEEGQIPEDDLGPGKAVDTGKKAPVRRKKKDDDGEEAEKPKRSRAKKAKKDDDEEEDEEEEEKPKRKRAPSKPAAEKKGKALAKKRASKKKDESEDDGEDFGDEIAAVGDDDDEEQEVEETTKKRKRAPASKASSSKPPSKKAKPAAKPASSRGRKRQEEIVEESEVEEDD